MKRREDKLKARAEKEIGVLKGYSEQYQKKTLVELDDQIAEIKARIDFLEEHLKNTDNEQEMEEYAHQIVSIDEVIRFVGLLKDEVKKNVDMLDQLINYSEFCYNKELYQFIIKTIPGKQLATLMKKDFEERDKLQSLLLETCELMERKVKEYLDPPPQDIYEKQDLANTAAEETATEQKKNNTTKS